MDYPKSLFKYSRFKKYTLNMIEKGYIYFCPANNLDDQFECLCDWRKYKELHIETILEVVRDVLFEFNLNISSISFDALYEDLNLNGTKALEYIKSKNASMSNEQAIQLFNMIKSLEKFFLPEFEESFKKTVLMQDYVGICSLAEESTNQVMWSMYANNYNGYCIEYDIEKALVDNPNLKNDLYKVQYTKYREIDPIKELLKGIYSEILSKVIPNVDPYNKDDLSKMIISIVTTKYIDWSFQKEWRFIGEPESKELILPIKAIYIGKNLSKTNKNNIFAKCKSKKIPVFNQKNDYVSLEIVFKELEVD